jgi:hypothetical protein
MFMSYYVKDLKNWCETLYKDSCKMFENSERWGLIVNSEFGVVMIVDVLKGKSWAAKCCPEDTFNMYIGYAIAYCKMKNISMPEEKRLVKLSELNFFDHFICGDTPVFEVMGFSPDLKKCVIRKVGYDDYTVVPANLEVEKVED